MFSLVLRHCCQAWNLWIGIYNGNSRQRLVGSWWFLRQTPMKFWLWENGKQINPLARMQLRERKICIMPLADLGQFWPIFAPNWFGFSEYTFFPLSTSTWKVQGSISTARGTFVPKNHIRSHLLPHFLTKNVLFRVQEYPKKSFLFFLSKFSHYNSDPVKWVS